MQAEPGGKGTVPPATAGLLGLASSDRGNPLRFPSSLQPEAPLCNQNIALQSEFDMFCNWTLESTYNYQVGMKNTCLDD